MWSRSAKLQQARIPPSSTRGRMQLPKQNGRKQQPAPAQSSASTSSNAAGTDFSLEVSKKKEFEVLSTPCTSPLTHLKSSPAAANEFFLQRSWIKGPSDPSGTLVNVSDRPSLCMSAQGNEVAVGSSDHAIYTIDVHESKLSRVLYGKSYGHTEWVTCVDHLPDGRIISGGMDNKLCLWEKRGVRSRDLKGHTSSISSVKAGIFDQAKHIAVSSSYDKSLILWDVGTSGREMGRLLGHKEAVMDFAASTKGRLVSGSREGTVVLWDVDARVAVLNCKNAHKGQVSALESLGGSFSETFLTGGQDGLLHVWDFRHNRPAHTATLHRSTKGIGALTCIAVTNAPTCECPLVITAGADRLVKVLDARASFGVVHTLEEHRDFIYSLYVNGSLLWSGGGDGSLLVHDLVAGNCLYGLGATKNGAVRGISLASEEKLVVTGDDGNVMLYSL